MTPYFVGESARSPRDADSHEVSPLAVVGHNKDSAATEGSTLSAALSDSFLAVLARRSVVAPYGFNGTPCVEWTGAATPQGYGQTDVRQVRRRTHRAAYEILIGPIPDGLEVDHLCGNPPCLNVTHLELVTKAENARRSWAPRSHGPHPRPGRLKLTPEKRAEVLRRYLAGESGSALAAEYGVTQQYVSVLKTRHRRATSASSRVGSEA